MLTIVLHNPTRSYTVGDTLRGKVIVDSAYQQTILGIKLKFQGFAGVKEYSYDVLYANKEWYMNNKSYVVGDGSTPIIYSGKTEFEFALVLRANLPPSFESSLGSIIYRVVVVVKRPLNVANTVKTIEFFVKAPVDLNKYPKIPMPAELQKGKTIGMLWNTSGEIGLHVKIPRRGYTCGETLPVQITLKNMSSKSVKAVRVSLVQEREYDNKKGIETVHAVAASVFLDGLLEYQGQAVRTTALQIPPKLTPSGPVGSKIIRVRYTLRVVVVIPGKHLNLKGKIPVLLGTVPLRVGATPIVLTSAPEVPQSRVDDVEDLEPPSYTDAVSEDLISFEPLQPVLQPMPVPA